MFWQGHKSSNILSIAYQNDDVGSKMGIETIIVWFLVPICIKWGGESTNSYKFGFFCSFRRFG